MGVKEGVLIGKNLKVFFLLILHPVLQQLVLELSEE
jgi:hypothetical protein